MHPKLTRCTHTDAEIKLQLQVWGKKILLSKKKKLNTLYNLMVLQMSNDSPLIVTRIVTEDGSSIPPHIAIVNARVHSRAHNCGLSTQHIQKTSTELKSHVSPANALQHKKCYRPTHWQIMHKWPTCVILLPKLTPQILQHRSTNSMATPVQRLQMLICKRLKSLELIIYREEGNVKVKQKYCDLLV